MRLVGGERFENIARSIAHIEPIFGGALQRLIVTELEAEVVAPIRNGVDLEAAFDKLPQSLQEGIYQSGWQAWDQGAGLWRLRTEQILKLIHSANADVAVVRLIQLLFALDLRRPGQRSTLDLSSTIMPGHLIVRDISIGSDVNWDGLLLLGALDARGLKVGRRLSCEQAQLLGPVWVSGCQIEKSARLGYSQFQSDFDASGSSFGGGIWLRYAQIKGEAVFSDCIFSSDSSFGACHYGGSATFSNAMFKDTASFEGAVFESDLSLKNAVFAKKVFFFDAAFNQGVSHEGTRFLGEVLPPLNSLIPQRNEVEKEVNRIREKFI
jgi:Pentapeptide repeats (9 copies)